MFRRPPFVLTVLFALGCSGSGSSDARLAELGDELARTNESLAQANDQLAHISERLARIEEQMSSREREAADRLERMRELRDQRRAELGDAAPDPTPGQEQLAAGIRCQNNTCKVQRALLDQILADPNTLARSARVVPVMEDGQQRGFKLFGMRSDTLPKQLGFENGDRILSVNGRALDSVDGAMDTYLQLRDAAKLQVEYERRGQLQTLEIEFE